MWYVFPLVHFRLIAFGESVCFVWLVQFWDAQSAFLKRHTELKVVMIDVNDCQNLCFIVFDLHKLFDSCIAFVEPKVNIAAVSFRMLVVDLV
jgi:hypothetical protein